MDAANVDLKAFTEEFYRKITYSHLQPVLDTLAWLKNETDVWFEITNLVIPGHNDDPDDAPTDVRLGPAARAATRCRIHFSAFHPDFRMMDRARDAPRDPPAAHETARGEGLKYVYVGNVHDESHQSTYCPHCGELVIERTGTPWAPTICGETAAATAAGAVAGRFDDQPGQLGTPTTAGGHVRDTSATRNRWSPPSDRGPTLDDEPNDHEHPPTERPAQDDARRAAPRRRCPS